VTEEERDKLKEDFRQTFAMFEPGMRVFEHLKKMCYYNSSTYVEGDPHRTSLREGMRIVFLDILNWLKE